MSPTPNCTHPPPSLRLLPKIGSLHIDEPPVLPKEPPDTPKDHLFDAKNHPDHVTGDDLPWLEPPERKAGGRLGLNRVTWVSFPHVCKETLELTDEEGKVSKSTE